MAPRKPKNPIKDLSDVVGGWLGGRGPGTNPVIQRYERDLGTVAQTIDTFTGGLGAAALRDARNFQQGGSLPTNVAKTAAVNLAAGAVGAKAAQVGGRAVAKTGVPARMMNKLTKQDIYLHGSPISGLKQINPGIGGNRTYSSKRGDLGFFENPKASETDFGGMASAYARKNGGGFGVVSNNRTGSVYVVKGPKKSFTSDPENQMVYQNTTPIVAISKQPQKVVSEIKLENVGLGKDARSKAVADALRKAGYKLPKKK
jgi:hypothetical protein